MNLRIRRPLAVTGALLLALSLAWKLHLGTPWTQRLPRGWSLDVRYVGTQTWADPATGKIPDDDVLAEYERGMRIVSENAENGSVLLEDRLTLRDIHTDSITWEYVTRLPVNARTGAHMLPEYAGEIAVFPRNVERRTYRLRSNYLKGIPLAFQREERIQGVDTYLFSYHGRAEYTESYLGSAQYPGITVPPGQELRCADDQFYYRVWIEPATGAQVKLEEGCPSGDFLFATGTDSAVTPVDRWNGITAGDDLVRRVSDVEDQRSRYLMMAVHIPLALVLLGLGCLAAGFRRVPGADVKHA